MDDGLEHLDEDPEKHIGDELPDPWDDESQSDWRSRATKSNDLSALLPNSKAV
jgi:hypothetical protein